MPHRYTLEQVKFIYEHVKGRSNKELLKMFNDYFKTDLTLTQIRAFKKNRKLGSGLTGHFEKGHTPFNKGKKGLSKGGEATQFKKGDKPWNHKPIGYERVDRDGYVLVKVSDTGDWHKRWKHKHKVIWEEANGPIPPGHKLLFADQNKQNITLDNLILVTNSQMAMINKNGLLTNNPDFNRTGILIADIYQKISDRKKKR
ncbi:HNH endonuclease signature motif containing protein [Heyndrickxia sporothermodurans]|uniref:HNH endonuclease signature motif containing protein n=1 Tax=Heyndrickxia sporothermodurans TaxID=46224 RepID=UPI0035D7BF2D